MDNIISDPNMVDPNKTDMFHPVNADTQSSEHRQKIAEHISMHYRKYLFWIGALCGFTISLFARVFFGTSATSVRTAAAYETTETAYESLIPEVKALIVYNQMDAIAHEKDNFFHQPGKIYTLSWETLFRKYDTMFHVLDNAYHRSIDTEEKLKRAKKLEEFLKIQNNLFASTMYTDKAQDQRFDELDKEFLNILDQMETSEANTGVNQTNTGDLLTGQEFTGIKIAQ